MEQSFILMKFFLHHVDSQWRWKIWKVKFSSGIFISIFLVCLCCILCLLDVFVRIRSEYTRQDQIQLHNFSSWQEKMLSFSSSSVFCSNIQHSSILPLPSIQPANFFFLSLCRKFKLPLLFDEGCYILSCHFIVKHVSDTCYFCITSLYSRKDIKNVGKICSSYSLQFSELRLSCKLLMFKLSPIIT